MWILYEKENRGNEKMMSFGSERAVLVILWKKKPFDWVWKRRKICNDVVKNKGLEYAVREGYVRVSGIIHKVDNDLNILETGKELIPLYYWKETRNGRPNPMYGRDLPKHSYIHTFGGYMLYDLESGYRPFSCNIYHEENINNRIPLNSMVSCGIVVQGTDKGVVNIRIPYRSGDIFTTLNENHESIVYGMSKHLSISLDNIEEEVLENYDWNRDGHMASWKVYSSYCTITDVSVPDGRDFFILHVDSVERGIYDVYGREIKPIIVFMTNDVNIPGVGTDIILFYSPRIKKGELFLDGHGFYIVDPMYPESDIFTPEISENLLSIIDGNSLVKEYIVNKYITLKLENNVTNIYVGGKLFQQCKYILLNIPYSESKQISKEIESVDDMLPYLDSKLESKSYNTTISPVEEFFGHCSNIEAWANNEEIKYKYDTRILHSNLSFPLLKRLSDLGEGFAKVKLQEEIIKRLQSKNESTVQMLLNKGYLKHLTDEQYIDFVEDLKKTNPGLLKRVLKNRMN